MKSEQDPQKKPTEVPVQPKEPRPGKDKPFTPQKPQTNPVIKPGKENPIPPETPPIKTM